MATLYIDNKPYEVTSGKNLLEVCLSLGIDLPYFCWHPALGSVGACRQCAIKIFKDENDKKGKLIMSCMEPVTNNQRISVSDAEAHEFRESVIGWLMTNHPHDCAVCDEGGSCHLQDMTVMTGHAYRKFNFNKRTYRNQDLGPFLNHEMNRCIQCYRCVRFYKDYAGGRDLDAFASRNQVYFGRSEDGVLENEFSGNLAEVCPTGVFTDKTLKQHYTRKWDLTTAPSVCQHCSLGCNIIAGERYGTLRMIGNRYNGEVNGYFLCDRGRFGYEFVNAPDRIREPVINGTRADRTSVLDEVAKSLKSRVIGIGSPRASLQSNFALKKLVGADHFYHGVSDNEHDLAELAIKILKDGPAKAFSMKEVETADAVFIVGEDITNTAPMMALAVRQSVRRQPMDIASKANIPAWNDAAVREIVQESHGPLYIADVNASKLDDISTATYFGAPHDIARLAAAVAHSLDPAAPAVPNLRDEQARLAKTIADALSVAARPVIITGTSCETDSVIKAAANVARALHKKNTAAGIVITLPECNSLGLAMMGGGRLNDAFNAVLHGYADTVIVMENDLYRHGNEKVVDDFLNKCSKVIVLDHSNTPTVRKAHVVIPAGTFAESDGIIVNNEGRAQRFFQVYEATDVIQESWRWILNIGIHSGSDSMLQWKSFENFTRAVASEEPLLKEIDKVTPPADFRVAGQRIPREPHRYSGRTALNANIAVSEPKPPEDPDSALSYTMEGFRGQPPSSMIPFFWSPGWNSVQSVNKYQEEVGASLRGGDPGVRLFAQNGSARGEYFDEAPEFFLPIENHLWFVWLHHIFGSEELSSRSEAVNKRIVKPYVMIAAADAKTIGLKEGDSLSFKMDDETFQLPVKVSASMSPGIAGVPYGLWGVPSGELPAWGLIENK
jgi:NADH-quinone oxidoreductase subunit G